MSIPAKIHYCWFGKNPLPKLALICINSWRKFCPEYEIIRWDETNINLCENRYIQQAYEKKKYAFVTDYVRLKVLEEYGGIYMDTDVEVIQNLDCFLKDRAFSGFERRTAVPTGIIGSEPGMPLFKEMLAYYEDREFVLPNGSLDTTTNVTIITKILRKQGLKLNGMQQVIMGMTFYPTEVFCPKNYFTESIICTENTYTIHHFNGSWKTDRDRFEEKIRLDICRRFGSMVGRPISYVVIFGSWIRTYGLRDGLKIIQQKLNNKVGALY